jgi:ABC-type branched-subunit amino acid transport system substrate-binding protein
MQCAAARSGRATEHCPFVYGAAAHARSLRLGAVLDLTGAEAKAALMQARASELAVNQLNAAGGVRILNEAASRPLALIVCDSKVGAAELQQVLSSLNVKALLGPSWSRSLAAVEHDVAALEDVGSVLLVAPLALSNQSRLGGVLTWSMTSSESDREPLLSAQLRAIEAQLAITSRALKLAFVMRTDSSMTSVRLAHQAISTDLQREIALFEYASASELTQIAHKLAAQQPDIVLSDGASEAIDLIHLLERALPTEDNRPQYLLTEAAQIPQLLMLAASNNALHERVTVVGAVPTASAASVHTAFEAAYRARYGDAPGSVAGVAASYSAIYAVAYATMFTNALPQDAGALATGLRSFGSNGLALSTDADSVAYAATALAGGQPIVVTGTLSELRWTEQGAPLGARVGVYCVVPANGSGDDWTFSSTGYEYDVDSSELAGQAVACAGMQRSTNAEPPSERSEGGVDDAMRGADAETSPDRPADGGVDGTMRDSTKPNCNSPYQDCNEPSTVGCECATICDAGIGECLDSTSECDLNGVYALKLTVPVSWPATTLLNAGSGEFVLWAHVQLSQTGNSLIGSVVPCGQTVPDFSNAILIGEQYGIEYPATIFDRTPLLPGVSATGALGAATPGASFSFGRTAWIAGIEMSDPVTGAWPSALELTPRDDDADGVSAITGIFKSGLAYAALPVDLAAVARADRGYIAARIVFELEGTLTSCTQASGSAKTQAIDSHTLGCSLSVTRQACDATQTNHLDINTPSYVVGPSTYTLQKIADNAGCSDVRATLP